MTVSEAIYLIVELKQLARRIGHDFEPDWQKVEALGFSPTDCNKIEDGIARNMRPLSPLSIEH